MHKHAIDWYAQLHLKSDVALVQKRWSTAETVAENLPRPRVIELLRLFLFATLREEFSQQFTNELIEIDPEFPVSNNAGELRLMAGLVMITTFGKPSHEADAFALGMRAASFPSGRIQPIQKEILVEAEEYLRSEAGRLRQNGFVDVSADVLIQPLMAQEIALSAAEAAGDVAKTVSAQTAYRDSIRNSISSAYEELANRIEQLAEESALLWWVLGEHSDALGPTNALDAEVYALVAAAEAAQRTMILPPPQSIGPLLARTLRSCKGGDKVLVLSDYFEVVDPVWRAAQVKLINGVDCRDLSPLSATLEKTHELDSAAAALTAIARLCPGVEAGMQITPGQVAHQFYSEVIFLRSLVLLEK